MRQHAVQSRVQLQNPNHEPSCLLIPPIQKHKGIVSQGIHHNGLQHSMYASAVLPKWYHMSAGCELGMGCAMVGPRRQQARHADSVFQAVMALVGQVCLLDPVGMVGRLDTGPGLLMQHQGQVGLVGVGGTQA